MVTTGEIFEKKKIDRLKPSPSTLGTTLGSSPLHTATCNSRFQILWIAPSTYQC